MCGLLSVTGIAGVVLLVVAWFGGPALAGSAIEASLASAGFQGSNTTVEVVTDPPFELLGGRADRIVIRSENATIDQLQAERFELSLHDADLGATDFSSVEGRLEGVTLTAANGTAVRAASVDLDGPPGDVEAVITIDGSEVERLALAEVERQTGVAVGSTSLEPPDLVTFSVLFLRVEGRFVVEPEGGLSLAVNLPSSPRVGLIADPSIRFESVQVVAGQLVLTGTVHLPALDGG